MPGTASTAPWASWPERSRIRRDLDGKVRSRARFLLGAGGWIPVRNQREYPSRRTRRSPRGGRASHACIHRARTCTHGRGRPLPEETDERRSQVVEGAPDPGAPGRLRSSGGCPPGLVSPGPPRHPHRPGFLGRTGVRRTGDPAAYGTTPRRSPSAPVVRGRRSPGIPSRRVRVPRSITPAPGASSSVPTAGT